MVPFPPRETELQPLTAAGVNTADAQKKGWTFGSVLSTLLKAHVNTCTELSLFKILQRFSLYMLVRKDFSHSFCWDVRTPAFLVFMTSFY